MQDWSLPLVVAAAAFLVAVLWRFRPSVPWSAPNRAKRAARRVAQKRIEEAPDDATRARALCEAAELSATSFGSGAAASGLLQRALRADPRSPEVVRRACAALSSRPRRLESLLWRHLAAAPWTDESTGAVRACLDGLRALYEGPLRSPSRARALSHAAETLVQRAHPS